MTTKPRKLHRRKTALIPLMFNERTGKAICISVPVTDAKKPVVFPGTLLDALKGRPGVSTACHLAHCAMNNHDAFPHPVILVVVNRSTAIVVTEVSKAGKPTRAVKYGHSLSWLVNLNDTDHEKQMIKQHPELAERTFRFRPPRKHYDPLPRKYTGERTRASSNLTLLRGSLSRAIKAGLISREQAPAGMT